MAKAASDIRRLLPKMDKVLGWPEIEKMAGTTPYAVLKEAIRESLDQIRTRLANQPENVDLSKPAVLAVIIKTLQTNETPSLKPVINGSGIVIHTNLGRSPLAHSAEKAILETSSGYSNLEFDLERGERGERYVHIEKLLCSLTGAEAAIVVNNNAAAVMLVLSSLAQTREVIVSRGELVEIGGSFRIPDVMRQSGATLVEVGTTNRTHPKDYRAAITEQTAMLLKVHTSNFAIVGFTSEVNTAEMVSIGKENGVPVVVDAGSGTLIDLARFGISGETTVQQHLKDGADVVTFSGDKLLGGPQAGLIVGSSHIISIMKRNPLLRAIRIDKLTLAALEATLRLYRDERQALAEVPTLRMLTMDQKQIADRAKRMLTKLKNALPSDFKLSLCNGASSPGGGSFPQIQLPTKLIEIQINGIMAHHLEEALRSTTPAVIGRVQKDRFMLDARTMNEKEMPRVADALIQAARMINANS